MRRLDITRTVKVNCDLSADEWELFTDSMDCTVAAETLNSTFNRLVNAGHTRRQVQNEMVRVMDEFSEYGASDSEPYYVLDYILREVFNDRD